MGKMKRHRRRQRRELEERRERLSKRRFVTSILVGIGATVTAWLTPPPYMWRWWHPVRRDVRVQVGLVHEVRGMAILTVTQPPATRV